MANKRNHGEGTIYYRKNEGRWCAQATIGLDENGKPKRITIYGKTKKEVKEKLQQTCASISKGLIVDDEKVTVEKWLETWLWEYKHQMLRPSTFGDYECIIRIHINPNIGNIRLRELRPEHLQKLYNQKFAEGKSDSKIRHIHNIMHAALDQAMKNGLIARNVSEATTLPKRKETREIKVLTHEEEKRFIEALEGERLRAAFIIAISTGVRLGELLALTWDNVDFKNGTIAIKKSIRRVKTFDENSQNKTQIVFQEPKTKSGKRTLPIPQFALKELQEHKKRQLEEKLQAGPLYKDNNLVFTTYVGTPIEATKLIKVFKKICKKAQIDINFHALRHTFATRLLEANEHPKVVQELLGHGDISITLNTYSHVLPEVKQKAMDKINSLYQNYFKDKKSK